tara:strand:+ start:319 stop:1029 length:711 start_codon:yes stop_codon:yes gene_type:complete
MSYTPEAQNALRIANMFGVSNPIPSWTGRVEFYTMGNVQRGREVIVRIENTKREIKNLMDSLDTMEELQALELFTSSKGSKDLQLQNEIKLARERDIFEIGRLEKGGILTRLSSRESIINSLNPFDTVKNLREIEVEENIVIASNKAMAEKKQRDNQEQVNRQAVYDALQNELRLKKYPIEDEPLIIPVISKINPVIMPKMTPEITPEITPAVVATSSLLPLGIIGLLLYSRTGRK